LTVAIPSRLILPSNITLSEQGKMLTRTGEHFYLIANISRYPLPPAEIDNPVGRRDRGAARSPGRPVSNPWNDSRSDVGRNALKNGLRATLWKFQSTAR
jgi:hypothetical protein